MIVRSAQTAWELVRNAVCVQLLLMGVVAGYFLLAFGVIVLALGMIWSCTGVTLSYVPGSAFALPVSVLTFASADELWLVTSVFFFVLGFVVITRFQEELSGATMWLLASSESWYAKGNWYERVVAVYGLFTLYYLGPMLLVAGCTPLCIAIVVFSSEYQACGLMMLVLAVIILRLWLLAWQLAGKGEVDLYW